MSTFFMPATLGAGLTVVTKQSPSWHNLKSFSRTSNDKESMVCKSKEETKATPFQNKVDTSPSEDSPLLFLATRYKSAFRSH